MVHNLCHPWHVRSTKKREKKNQKKSREPLGEWLETLNGAEQTTAPMSAEQDGVPCNQHGADIMRPRGRHGRRDTEMELIAKTSCVLKQ